VLSGKITAAAVGFYGAWKIPALRAFREKMARPAAQEQYRQRGRVVEFCHAWIKKASWAAAVSRARPAQSGTELLWACLTYNLQHWIRLTSCARLLRPAEARKASGLALPFHQDHEKPSAHILQ